MTKVLLVDDEENNRDMLQRRLARRGYEVVTAVDGEDACQKALAETPSVILMDMRMPRTDGYEATQRIRSMPETKAIPIVGLTAQAMAGDRERVLEVGCDAYEPKPVNFAQLLTTIEALLERSSGP